jgi:hypothetical protein
MRYLKNFDFFIESKYDSGLAIPDSNIPEVVRSRDLNEEEFLDILKSNCKNFSFENDLLWRSKQKRGGDFELFEPNLRRARPLAFPKFFNTIKDNPDFPVKRQKSLIGGTKKEALKILVSNDMWLVIPFDNSQIVFCPIVDLWALDDKRKEGSEKVANKDVSKENFIMTKYGPNFQIPLGELNALPRANTSSGVEFFTSSPCLLLHDSKVDWLKSKLS